MAREVKVKAVGKYNGHNIKANKSVDIAFKMDYSELVNSVKLLQMLNENITVAVKVGDTKPKILGMYMVKEVKFDHDGESLVKFNSTLDYIEADNLNGLAGEILNILFKAKIEEEDGDD